MASRPQLLLTNDDGIDSVGLHILARTMRQYGDVTIVAPDSEFSGAGAAIGAIWEMKPEVHEAHVEGIDKAWSVSGPPALCVMYSRMGAFGFTPDLIISGINPGVNVGRSVYHSGTIGACLTGRNGGVTGVAVSQKVDNFGVEGQAWADSIGNLQWQAAADVAGAAVAAILDSPPAMPSVLNVNVPNQTIEQLTKFRWTEVGQEPPRSFTNATLTPKEGHVGSYNVDLEIGDKVEQAPGTDTQAIIDNEVSLTWLSQIVAEPGPNSVARDNSGIDANVRALLS